MDWRETAVLEAAWQEDPESLDLFDAPDAENDEENEVECILDERELKAAGHEYLVKWVGFATPTWTPAMNVADCEALDR